MGRNVLEEHTSPTADLHQLSVTVRSEYLTRGLMDSYQGNYIISDILTTNMH